MDVTVLEFILYYGKQGLSYKEISVIVEKIMGVKISPIAIGKKLKNSGMHSRRGPTIHTESVVKAVIEQTLHDIPKTVGYRQMTSILRQKSIHVRRDTVMKLMREIDPLAVGYRRRRRINRRVYRSFGPNYVWHIDGYDKLKPYGFPIHGCIDGYSRKIMWLTVGPSNNDPAIVARNYVKCVDELKGCPTILQADPGTENSICGSLQCVFTQNTPNAFDGFRVVRSKFNQRIEAWWSMLRRNTSQWWIDLFKDLEAFGGFRRGNQQDMLCLRYCFMPAIQRELDKSVERWNNHLISFNRHASCPHGRPNVLYSVPELTGGKNCLQFVGPDDLEFAYNQCTKPTRSGSEEFDLFAQTQFLNCGWDDADSWEEALKQYFSLNDIHM